MWCVLTISSGPERFLLSVQATGAIPVGLIGMKKEMAVSTMRGVHCRSAVRSQSLPGPPQGLPPP